MLGSDPIAAFLGAGIDPRAPQGAYRKYLTHLVRNGAAVVMLGPDVVVPDDADPETTAALASLLAGFPPGTRMPESNLKVLKDVGQVDASEARARTRVDFWWKTAARFVGKDCVDDLVSAGVVTPMVGIHVGMSGMVAVSAPGAEALAQWRDWSAQISGDPYERHTGPTVLLPTMIGGGVYLFRTDADTEVPADLTMRTAGCVIETGDVVVPIPPSRFSGQPVSRLGPARMLPSWLRTVLLESAPPAIAV